MTDSYLYPYSAEEARRRNELSLWRASHQANITCKQAIEESIRQNFDGMHLNDNCLRCVLEEFGYKRTAWVLSNTLREKTGMAVSARSTKRGRKGLQFPLTRITTVILLSIAIPPF